MHDASLATSGALSNRISTEASREHEFPAAAQIRAAADDAGRARILLRIPDLVVVEEMGALSAACRDASFGSGITYVAARAATLLATRDAEGLLPQHLSTALHASRLALVYFAGVRR